MRRSHSGFTLIELLVTLTVLGVMMGLAVPSFRDFIAGQRVKAASHDLMMALVMARSEAIKRNADVTVAPDTANVWTAGWTVKAAPAATTILQQQALPGVTITLGPATVLYKANGRPTASSKFQVAGTSGIKCVKVDLTGIPSSQSGACP